MSEEKKEWYTVYDQIRKTVVLIHRLGTFYGPGQKGGIITQTYPVWQGSGFIYQGKDEKLGLITAYHVVRCREGERIRVWAVTRAGEWIKVDNCEISAQYSSEEKDIAVLSFDPPGRTAKDFETVIFPAQVFRGATLRVGADIVWCAYPVAVKQFTTVLQKGMIAGHNGSQYIIDGTPSPGSSGGPIFFGYSALIAGMITAQAPEPSRYRLAIVEGYQNKVDQIFTSPSGLAIAVPAADILAIFRK